MSKTSHQPKTAKRSASIVLPPVGPVRIFPPLVPVADLPAPGLDYFSKSFGWLENCGPGLSSWKTSQRSVFGGWIESPPNWPRSGIVSNGKAYARRTSAPPTFGNESLSWQCPPPTVHGNHKGISKKAGDGLVTWTKRWPTPAARDYRHPNKKTYQKRGGGKKANNSPTRLVGR